MASRGGGKVWATNVHLTKRCERRVNADYPRSQETDAAVREDEYEELGWKSECARRTAAPINGSV